MAIKVLSLVEACRRSTAPFIDRLDRRREHWKDLGFTKQETVTVNNLSSFFVSSPNVCSMLQSSDRD